MSKVTIFGMSPRETNMLSFIVFTNNGNNSAIDSHTCS